MNIDWSFSVTWLIIGLVIILGGGLTVFFYRQISENLANGVSSYDKVKKYGVIAIIVGIIVTANLHTFVLELFVNLFFKH
ncbi:hypothetical protein J6T21_04030 [Candidatus Saccharibacteria bacterium]|nr:hypothetical protein [Candidatus Saccharibacteria bacterium]